MAIGRNRYAPPVSTKGHSVLKTRSYGLSTRTPPISSVSPRSAAYGTRAEEHLLADRVSNVNYLSNVLMDEGYDTALRSRGRDQALLKEATNAIVSAENYATPQTSVASRRVARGESVATRAASVPPRAPPRKPEVEESTTPAPQAAPLVSPPSRRPIVILPPQGARGQDRSASVPPPVVIFREDPSQRRKAPVIPTMTREERRSKLKVYSQAPAPAVKPLAPVPVRPVGPYRSPLTPIQEVREPRLLPSTVGLKAHRPPPRGHVRQQQQRGAGHPLTRSLKPAPLQESLRGFPRVYVPTQGQRPSSRYKAAIIASKMEPDPIKRRRPRSEFAASRYREIRREKLESPVGGGSTASGGSERRRR